MMQKMVPLDKMSKKQRSAVHRAKRGNWNGVVPVTRVKESGKRYKRCRETAKQQRMNSLYE